MYKNDQNKSINYIDYINIQYTKLYIGTNAGNEIEKAIKNAKKFVYIISPFTSKEKIELLIDLNRNIDKKLILCDNSNFSSHKSLKSIIKLFKYKKVQQYPKLKIEKENKKLKILNLEAKKKNFWLLIFIASIFSSFALYHLKFFNNILMIFLTLFIFISLVNIFSYNGIKHSIIKKYEDEINFLRETTKPNMEFKFNTKIINSNDKKFPYTHLKLYIMDFPELSEEKGREFHKAFLSSANFTNSGLDGNLEFVIQSTDINCTKKLIEFFNNLYTKDDFIFYDSNSLDTILFQNHFTKNFD